MPAFDYDLCVIGAGSGGVRAARQAAARGARVVVVEKGRLGGTCVNVGCVPKKFLVYASEAAEGFETAAAYGWHTNPARFEWSKLRDGVAKEISRLNGIYEGLLEKAGVTIVRGRGRLAGPQAVHVEGGRTLTCRTILLATGAWPFVPDLPGKDLCLTSNDMFTLPQLPKTLAIVGGGYIAVEFAGIMQGLGVQTTIVHRGSQILNHFDDDVRGFAADEMRKKGVKLVVCSAVSAVEAGADGKRNLLLSNGERLSADEVLMATGRRPLTAGLGLEEFGIKCDEQGHIVVNAAFQTSCSSVYAIGDLIASPALTPVATAEAMVFVDKVFGSGSHGPLSYAKLATAVFCQPSIGTVGLSETQARKVYEQLDIYETNFRPLKHTLSGQPERCYMKLVVERQHGTVVGAHMVGAEAGEIVQGLAVAMQAGATKADFDRTIGIHPTTAEEFVTLRTPVRSWG